jgi:hypothetical protein
LSPSTVRRVSIWGSKAFLAFIVKINAFPPPTCGRVLVSFFLFSWLTLYGAAASDSSAAHWMYPIRGIASNKCSERLMKLVEWMSYG